VNKWGRLILSVGMLVLGACTRHAAQVSPAALPSLSPPPPADVLTQHSDSARTGSDLNEIRLKPAELQAGRFGRLFEWTVDGEIYAQPLYVSQVPRNGTLVNLSVVATMNNSVYAFIAPPADSSAKPPGEFLWKVDQTKLGPPLPDNFLPMSWTILGRNIHGTIGIVSTPVVDRPLGRVFVTVKTGTRGPHHAWQVHYWLYALDLLSGDIKGSIEINPTFTGPDGHTLSFDAAHELQRAGLLEANGRIYMAFASHQDTEAYHGWVVAYEAATLNPVGVYCDTCGDTLAEKPDRCSASCLGGIWQAGGGPAADASGSIYLMTGNGTFDKDRHDFGSSFIKFDRDVKVVGSWTPPNYKCLTETDADLGSAGPLILGNWLIGGGKQGLLYSIRADLIQAGEIGSGTPAPASSDPCGYLDTPSANVHTIQAAPPWEASALMYLFKLFARSGLAMGYHHIHGAPVAWTVHDPSLGDRILVYLSAERDLLRAFEFKDGIITGSRPGSGPTDTFASHCANSRRGMPGGFLTLSASGGDPKSGIIWASMPRRDQDALNDDVPGVLRAYAAYPGADGVLSEIWNSDEGANPSSDTKCRGRIHTSPKDELGLFAKFAAPTVGDGKVYMPTFSKQLVAYGLLPQPPAVAAAVTPPSYDAALTRSPLPGTAAPNAVIAVSVKLTNRGSAPWQPSDRIHLSSKLDPSFATEITEAPSALEVTQRVEPGQSYGIEFHLRVPDDEEIRYYEFQLEAESLANTRVGGGWFGDATPQQRVVVLRPQCAGLRRQAEQLTETLPPPSPHFAVPGAQVGAFRSLVEKARQANCRLLPKAMQMEEPE
jgi:hypothetical protein